MSFSDAFLKVLLKICQKIMSKLPDFFSHVVRRKYVVMFFKKFPRHEKCIITFRHCFVFLFLLVFLIARMLHFFFNIRKQCSFIAVLWMHNFLPSFYLLIQVNLFKCGVLSISSMWNFSIDFLKIFIKNNGKLHNEFFFLKITQILCAYVLKLKDALLKVETWRYFILIKKESKKYA